MTWFDSAADDEPTRLREVQARSELMPKQHRRTYGAIFEVMLASAFTLLPFVGFVLVGNPDGFRLIALPGGLALGIVPLLVHFGLPESARWHLRHGEPQKAVATVNRLIALCGNRVPELTVAELGPNLADVREKLPPFSALFARGQLRHDVSPIFLTMPKAEPCLSAAGSRCC